MLEILKVVLERAHPTGRSLTSSAVGVSLSHYPLPSSTPLIEAGFTITAGQRHSPRKSAATGSSTLKILGSEAEVEALAAGARSTFVEARGASETWVAGVELECEAGSSIERLRRFLQAEGRGTPEREDWAAEVRVSARGRKERDLKASAASLSVFSGETIHL